MESDKTDKEKLDAGLAVWIHRPSQMIERAIIRKTKGGNYDVQLFGPERQISPRVLSHQMYIKAQGAGADPTPEDLLKIAMARPSTRAWLADTKAAIWYRLMLDRVVPFQSDPEVYKKLESIQAYMDRVAVTKGMRHFYYKACVSPDVRQTLSDKLKEVGIHVPANLSWIKEV